MRTVIALALSATLAGCSSLGAAYDTYIAASDPNVRVQILVLQERYCETEDVIAKGALEQAIAGLSVMAKADELCL